MEQFKIIDEHDKVLAVGITLKSNITLLEWTSAIKTLSFYDNIEQVKEFVCNRDKGTKLVSLKPKAKDRLREYYL
ncbi:hypothetical protein [Bacillus thuringiensis]|nr:hypothetical protein [Bacillus thuringiensis]PFC28455.1 hypothetical protein CN299_19485 [Bacillus thuringiensis]